MSNLPPLSVRTPSSTFAPPPRRSRSLATVVGGACLGLLAACSGGSNAAAAGAPPNADNLDLFIDTATGSDVLITGRLSIVALEAQDGTLTPDLLAGDPEVKLSDPLGEFTGPRLSQAPAGTYVAAHLLFLSQDLTGLRPDNTQVVIRLPRRDFRLPLDRPMVLGNGPQSWFTLRHDGPIELVPVENGFAWTPNWVAQVADVQLLRSARVTVLAVDPVGLRVDGELHAAGTIPVVLDLSRADDLFRDGERLDRVAFLAALRAGEVLTIDGWLDSWRNIRVIAASVDGEEGSEPKSEVRGEILELFAERSAFVLNVLEVRKDRTGLPGERPLHLTVRVDDRTRIKWLPRLGRHTGHLPFSALRTGMLVDVEWHGPAPELQLTAKKVDIHAASRAAITGLLSGEVREVEVTAGTFVLQAHGHSTFRIGDQRFESLVVRVDDRSYLCRRAGGDCRRVGLEQLAVGARLLLLAERVEGNVVHALLARIEERGRRD